MRLDDDLQALIEKVDLENDDSTRARFDDSERRLMREAIHASQTRRDYGEQASASHFRRELDFFVVCLGFGLVAFAVLVMMRWSAAEPLGAPGVFGLAFLAGVSGAVFRHFYLRPDANNRGLILGAAAIVMLVCLIALVAAHAIGGLLGIVLGAVFFRALMRQRLKQNGLTTTASD
ncbi:hypothetical protein SSPSH_002962 [Salinisphaera shabanensis E1L3A]|uniref:Uncharacterized protein n=1 Tax=Salinisphaera shabanensis E1L3A TaxID=1033802 RepID=U2EJJ9_9GAMM|nr:hypothetical protein [Salinisphaera shabanensis]ERJ18185.1 hypothetical protein SSPSH_002962 [Salinisphaera shabanensis E1L3A]